MRILQGRLNTHPWQRHFGSQPFFSKETTQQEEVYWEKLLQQQQEFDALAKRHELVHERAKFRARVMVRREEMRQKDAARKRKNDMWASRFHTSNTGTADFYRMADDAGNHPRGPQREDSVVMEQSSRSSLPHDEAASDADEVDFRAAQCGYEFAAKFKRLPPEGFAWGWPRSGSNNTSPSKFGRAIAAATTPADRGGATAEWIAAAATPAPSAASTPAFFQDRNDDGARLVVVSPGRPVASVDTQRGLLSQIRGVSREGVDSAVATEPHRPATARSAATLSRARSGLTSALGKIPAPPVTVGSRMRQRPLDDK